MGRPRKPPPPGPEVEAQLEALRVDNARLEALRVEVLARPRTVASQLEHAWLGLKSLSNLRAAAMLRGVVTEVVSLSGAIEKAEAAIRGLAKMRVDDTLAALVARIERGDAARDVLAAAEDDA